MWRKIPVSLLILIILLSSRPIIYAQGGKTHVRFTLASAGYDNLPLQGKFSNAKVELPLRSDWEIVDTAQVTVGYTASPVITSSHTTLTVLINDKVVQTVHPITDGIEHTFTFAVPIEILSVNKKGIGLSFEAVSRITNDSCEESNNAGQWMIIGKDTMVEFNISAHMPAPSLDNLTGALVIQNSVTATPPLLFVLSDNADSAEMSTMARIAMRLGNSIRPTSSQISVVHAKDLTQTQRNDANLVIIRTPKTIDPLFGELYTALKLPVPTEKDPGFIRILTSPWSDSRRVLVVYSVTPDDETLVNQAFINAGMFSALQGDQEDVISLGLLTMNQQGADAWAGDTVSFTQLGDADRTVIGMGSSAQSYYFPLPYGWLLQPDMQLTLNLVSSPMIEKDRSYISVSINDVEVGTAPIQDVGKDYQVAFKLPVDKLQFNVTHELVPYLSMRITVNHDVPNTACEDLVRDSIWTVIKGTSFFKPSYSYAAWPDLQWFPYPFLSEGTPAPITIVLPNQPSNLDMTRVAMLAALLGRNSPAQLDIRITTAADFTPDQYKDSHLIVLGVHKQQPLIDQITEKLDVVKSVAVVAAMRDPGFGVLRVGVSPWNEERAVLLVYSESQASFDLAMNSVLTLFPLVKIPGQLAVVDKDHAPRVVFRSISLAEPLAEGSTPVPAIEPPAAAPTAEATVEATAAATEAASGAASVDATPTKVTSSVTNVVLSAKTPVGEVHPPAESIPPTKVAEAVNPSTDGSKGSGSGSTSDADPNALADNGVQSAAPAVVQSLSSVAPWRLITVGLLVVMFAGILLVVRWQWRK